MKRCMLLICTVVILFPAAAHAQKDVEKKPNKEPAKTFTVPFELIKTQHMVVNIKVNGKGPYRLIFDTGAPDSLVSNKIYKEAGLVAKGGGLPIFGSRGQATIKDLEIGDLKTGNLSCMVMDHPTVGAIAKFVGPIEGILGFTFYARFNMSIDYEKKLLTFEPNDYEPGDVMKAMMARFTAPRSVRDAPKILAPAGLLGFQVGKEKDDEAAGVAVKEVMPDSPAAAAGFKKGDRLLTLDGRWTDTVADCYIAAGMVRPGTAATAQILRNGKKMQLQVTPRAGL